MSLQIKTPKTPNFGNLGKGPGLLRFGVSHHSQGFSHPIPGTFPTPFPVFPGVFPIYSHFFWALTALDGGEFGGEGGGDAGVPQLHHRCSFLFQVPQHLTQPLLRDWEFPKKTPKSPRTARKMGPKSTQIEWEKREFGILGDGVGGPIPPPEFQDLSSI